MLEGKHSDSWPQIHTKRSPYMDLRFISRNLLTVYFDYFAQRPLTEDDIVALLPSKQVTLDSMIITKLLSSKGTNSLGDFEVQYMYEPFAVNAAHEWVLLFFLIHYFVNTFTYGQRYSGFINYLSLITIASSFHLNYKKRQRASVRLHAVHIRERTGTAVTVFGVPS